MRDAERNEDEFQFRLTVRHGHELFNSIGTRPDRICWCPNNPAYIPQSDGAGRWRLRQRRVRGARPRRSRPICRKPIAASASRRKAALPRPRSVHESTADAYGCPVVDRTQADEASQAARGRQTAIPLWLSLVDCSACPPRRQCLAAKPFRPLCLGQIE